MYKSRLGFLKSLTAKTCQETRVLQKEIGKTFPGLLFTKINVKRSNKWLIFLIEEVDQVRPTGILYITEQAKSADDIEVVQIIKRDLTTKSTDIMILNYWAIKWQVKFCTDKCKVLKMGEKQNCIHSVPG